MATITVAHWNLLVINSYQNICQSYTTTGTKVLVILLGTKEMLPEEL